MTWKKHQLVGERPRSSWEVRLAHLVLVHKFLQLLSIWEVKKWGYIQGLQSSKTTSGTKIPHVVISASSLTWFEPHIYIYMDLLHNFCATKRNAETFLTAGFRGYPYQIPPLRWYRWNSTRGVKRNRPIGSEALKLKQPAMIGKSISTTHMQLPKLLKNNSWSFSLLDVSTELLQL